MRLPPPPLPVQVVAVTLSPLALLEARADGLSLTVSGEPATRSFPPAPDSEREREREGEEGSEEEEREEGGEDAARAASWPGRGEDVDETLLPCLEQLPPPPPPPSEIGASSEMGKEALASDFDSDGGSWTAAAMSTPEMTPEHASKLEEKATTNWVPAG